MELSFRYIGINMIGALKDLVLGVWIGINWLMMQSDGGVLWKQWRNVGFHKSTSVPNFSANNFSAKMH